MPTCKFCGVTEGMPDRKGRAAHINRDGLCAACYNVLEKMKRQPGKLSYEDRRWFDETCQFNFKRGMFVPVAQRRTLRATQPWSCAKCGNTNPVDRDDNYKKYCIICAQEARCNRRQCEDRKKRSDIKQKHRTVNMM